jgi:hypothetical protein
MNQADNYPVNMARRPRRNLCLPDGERSKKRIIGVVKQLRAERREDMGREIGVSLRKTVLAVSFKAVALYLFLHVLTPSVVGQASPYPHNAVSCERCHTRKLPNNTRRRWISTSRLKDRRGRT